MIPVPYDFLLWERWNYNHWLSKSITDYAKRGEKKRDEITQAVMQTGVVKNTHQPFHPKDNPRVKVDEHQAKVIAWSIAKKEGHYVGHRPQRKE